MGWRFFVETPTTRVLEEHAPRCKTSGRATEPKCKLTLASSRWRRVSRVPANKIGAGRSSIFRPIMWTVKVLHRHRYTGVRNWLVLYPPRRLLAVRIKTLLGDYAAFFFCNFNPDTHMHVLTTIFQVLYLYVAVYSLDFPFPFLPSLRVCLGQARRFTSLLTLL